MAQKKVEALIYFSRGLDEAIKTKPLFQYCFYTITHIRIIIYLQPHPWPFFKVVLI